VDGVVAIPVAPDWSRVGLLVGISGTDTSNMVDEITLVIAEEIVADVDGVAGGIDALACACVRARCDGAFRSGLFEERPVLLSVGVICFSLDSEWLCIAWVRRTLSCVCCEMCVSCNRERRCFRAWV